MIDTILKAINEKKVTVVVYSTASTICSYPSQRTQTVRFNSTLSGLLLVVWRTSRKFAWAGTVQNLRE